ncbi:hypothetical protein AB0X64_02575 [Limosilactobacillus vaginalis]|uniref:hypothetical protein n=1 Tax=Limosilactobacillus vaginalis TaxID=1633 RepID=UPI003F20DF93
MTKEEFEKRWSQFIKEFNQNFDSPEVSQQLQDVAIQNTDNPEDLKINYEHIYQQQRMDNLVKDAIASFLDFDEN